MERRWQTLERWRSLDRPVQDLIAALTFAAAWFGATSYLKGHDWYPRDPQAYDWAGLWGTAVVALRRRWPYAVLLAAVVAYPSLTDGTFHSEFQFLPIVIAAYAVTERGHWASAAAFGATVASVYVLMSETTVSRGRVMPVVVASGCVVLLGGLVHDQRRAAGVLAERNAELERLRQAEADRAVAAERTRIARELHDVVAHHLTAMSIQANAALRVSGASSPAPDEGPAIAALRQIGATAKEALEATRTTVRVLRDPDGRLLLAPTAGLEDLPRVVAGVQAAGLPVGLQVSADVGRWEPQVEQAAIRIVQEALTNVLRHAEADGAEVRLAVGDRGDGAATALEVTVVDDGRGASRSGPGDADRSAGGGMGLVHLRERAASCGGSLEAGPTESGAGGWTVRAVLPGRRTGPSSTAPLAPVTDLAEPGRDRRPTPTSPPDPVVGVGGEARGGDVS